jgi:hypothetical protein
MTFCPVDRLLKKTDVSFPYLSALKVILTFLQRLLLPLLLLLPPLMLEFDALVLVTGRGVDRDDGRGVGRGVGRGDGRGVVDMIPLLLPESSLLSPLSPLLLMIVLPSAGPSIVNV